MAALAHPRPGVTSWPYNTEDGGNRRAGGRHLELVWSRPVPVRPTGAVFLRRRAVALVLAILVGVGVWSIVSAGVSWLSSSPAGVESAVPASSDTWTVGPGDTLWDIARSVQPTGDIRPLVSQLSAERSGAALQVGETVHIPN